MIKLLIISVFVAIASADNYEVFNGDWKFVKVFPNITGMVQKCQTLKFTVDTSDETVCGGKDVPFIKAEHNEQMEGPVIVVKTQDEVKDALHAHCNNYDEHVVVRHLADGYFTFHFISDIGDTTMLMAKTVPTEAELDEFVKTHGLQNTPGVNICTKELENASNSRRTLAAEDNKLPEALSVKKKTVL